MATWDDIRVAALALRIQADPLQPFDLAGGRVDPGRPFDRVLGDDVPGRLDRVPVHVIPCIEGRVDNAPNLAAASRYGSILPAAWSFMLALRSRGLGSAWTTLHLYKEKEAAELLGIPEDITQVALLPVAYTMGDDFNPAQRPPVEGITYWDAWGSTR